jgi:O-antigen ligase/polysaccharide polymerase Wzy-like membrane protein
MSGLDVERRLRVSGRACLVVLAALLPFEMAEPLARVGPLQISSVEIFLYLALAAWGAALLAGWLSGDRDARAWLRQLPRPHAAAAVLVAVLFASAACAPELRATALKFALRSLGGVLLYAAAADLLRAPAAAARAATALVAGALVAAGAMIAEAHAGRAEVLRPFHAQTFEVFGLIRACGPFQYPNIAAMYLEAVLPVGLALGASSISGLPRAGLTRVATPRARRWLSAGTVLVVLVLLDGVLVTASRAGLVTAIVVTLGLAVVLGRAPAARARMGAVAVAVVVLVVASQLASSAFTLRLAFWKDADWYRAGIEPVAGPAGQAPAVLAPGEEAVVALQLRNLGALTWTREPPSPVALSYHWLDAATSTLVVFDGVRTSLPYDVPPGVGVTVNATAQAPRRSGRYILWWDLVHEHATWFSERGNPGLRQSVEVRSGATPRATPAPGGFRLLPSDVIQRPALWRAAVAAWRQRPLLGLGPDNFRHLYGGYLGLASFDDRFHANSLFFETLASVGTAGLLALAWLVASLARSARQAAAAPATRTLALGLGAGLGAYLLHGALDYFFEFTPTYALFWLLGGMVVALGRPSAEPGS